MIEGGDESPRLLQGEQGEGDRVMLKPFNVIFLNAPSHENMDSLYVISRRYRRGASRHGRWYQ